MFALISPIEPRETGYRVVQVETQPFEVAEPLFWVECGSEIMGDKFWYNPEDKQFYLIPESESAISPS